MSSGSSPIMVIDGPIKLTIALVDIESVYHHEEVIPSLLEELTREIERDGFLKHPVILDGETFVVLDGTHRIEALKSLRCRLVPACLVDYSHPGITLGCWYRTLRGVSSLQELLRQLRRRTGLAIEMCGPIRPEEVGRPPTALALTDGKSYARAVADFQDKWDAWALVRKVEKVLTSLGIEIGFETEKDAMRKLARGEADVVLMTPRITKDDVVRIAKSKRVLPYKATRHVIPARPLFLNIPLEALRSEKPLEELEEELRRMLASRRVRRYPPGSVIEGRRYEEEVYVLE